MIFLNSASSAAALVFYLPGVCTHTDTEVRQRKARVGNIFKNSEKNTIFNEHPVYMEKGSQLPKSTMVIMGIIIKVCNMYINQFKRFIIEVITYPIMS